MIRLLNRVVHVRILTLFLSETILIFACFLAAAFSDPDLEFTTIFLIYDFGLVRIAVVVAVILLGLYLRGFYSQLRIQSRVFLFLELCTIFGISLLGQGIISYIHRDWTVPRKVALGGTVLAMICAFGWRLLFDLAARGAVEPKPVLFLGMSPTVIQLASHFSANPEFGLKPIGYLESGEQTLPAPEDMPRLGSISDLSTVLNATHPNSVVIGRREDIRPSWASEFMELRFSGVNAEQAATLYEKTFGRVCVAEIWPSKMIFGDTWKTRPVDITVQTLYSTVMAAVGVVILLPAMALISILIKLGSPGPVLVSETRIGMHGIRFQMYGFRCVREGSEGYTPIGRLLHWAGLDALPQLFNVVAGQMAIVGPEPHRPEFTAWLSGKIPFYRQRQEVKPGLTGWAKIHFDSGSAEWDVLRRLEYDLYYIKKLSLAMDSQVLLLALKIRFLGK